MKVACRVRGCDRTHPPGFLACRRCLWDIPSDLQHKVRRMYLQITHFRRRNLRDDVIRKAIEAFREAESEALESVVRCDDDDTYEQDQFEFTTGRRT